MYGVTFKEITWEEILPMWRDHLWLNRITPIEPVSAMRYLGGYDMLNMESTPYFQGMVIDDQLVGVNSGHETGNGQFRSRGLYILPAHRGQRLGSHLLLYTISIAKTLNCNTVWSFPRESSLITYEMAGFCKTSYWMQDGVEFGPNCYVLHNIDYK